MKNFILATLAILTIANSSAQRYRVLISEIMVDPSPAVGLPAYEWMELHNPGTEPVLIGGWRLGDASGLSGPLPSLELQAGAFVIVGSATAVAALQAFGTCLSVSNWPSLDNGGDQLVLYDNDGRPVHEVFYEPGWYQNTVKQDGGWSLEMTNLQLPCMGKSNWRASENPLGGSPGSAPNFLNNFPIESIRTLTATAINNQQLLLTFNHAPDSQWMKNPGNYQLPSGPGVQACETSGLPFTQVILQLATAIEENTVYTIVARNITDCSGSSGFSDSLLTGLPSEPEPGDILINEIFFNPPPDGCDFIEIINNSSRIVNLAQLQLASRNSAGQLQSWQRISGSDELFFPGQYLVVCTDTAWLRRRFPRAPVNRFRSLNSMPGYSDSEGTAVLLRLDGAILDELRYQENWHFPLLPNRENVSLERLSVDLATQDAVNWHSASGTVDFGTPGYANSQSTIVSKGTGRFQLSSSLFSPGNDGIDDRLLIFYEMETTGVQATSRVFNAVGHPVRLLFANSLLGRTGQFVWDGLDDFGRPLPTGIYIIWIEWFDLNGRRGLWKGGVVKR